MFVPIIDRLIGIEVYATKSAGIGGTIRESVEDFIVEEILVDGSKAEISNFAQRQVLGASHIKNRYLLCVLIKRNWDTFHAVRNIAGQLGIDPRQVHIAGIKDAKAVTAQHITLEDVSMEDLQKVNVKDLEIRGVGYMRHKISAYYMLGNSFNIGINAINRPESTIQRQIAETIKELEAVGGVSNFFGHQRFGTRRPITHLVGKAMVKGDFRKAAMLFLAKPSRYEHPESMQARKELEATGDFKQALQGYPRQLRYERLMLRHLVGKENFIGAFKRLPIKLRLLFVQAYQAYLFNRFLSRRIASGFSLNKAEIGDYVVNVERSGLPFPAMHRMVRVDTAAEINDSIRKGKMQVAFPLVGFKQHLSRGIMEEIEKRILEEEDVKPEDFKITLMPEISEGGELRTVATPVKNFSLQEISCDKDDPQKYQARLCFMLFRGCYATTFLREIMKPRNPVKSGF